MPRSAAWEHQEPSFFWQNLPRRVGDWLLPLGKLHHLAFEKVQGGDLAGSEIRRGTRIRTDDLVSKRPQ